MSSTYSPILRTELIGSGDQAGAWGATTNSNFQYIFESAIAGYVAVTVSPSSNNQVLTYVNGPSASAALDQSIYAIIKLNAGTLGANFNIYAPPVSKTFIIWNNTSYAATFYNSSVIGNTTAAGSGVTVPAGSKVWIWSDGTNFWGNDTIANNLTVTGNLSIGGNETITGTLGVTGIATFTAQPIMSSLTASQAVFTDGSKGLISVANTGTGSNVLAVSPALTGTPTAPTPSGSDNSTTIATTAFVQSKVGTLGTMATQNANAVAITGGTLNGVTGTSSGLTVGTAGTCTGNAATATAPAGGGTFLTSSTKLGLGITGETWHNLTGTNVANQTYTNSRSYPIMVNIQLHSGSSGTNPSYLYVNGNAVANVNGGGWTGGMDAVCSAIVPPGATYSTNSSSAGSSWWELY